jgi:hypothetical protein
VPPGTDAPLWLLGPYTDAPGETPVAEATVSFSSEHEDEMHPAAKFQIERAVREFSQWRAVPADERSPAPAWWWQPAFEIAGQQEEMPPLWCHRLELPLSSTYAAGAAVLMATLVDQTSLPWPDEFPRKIERAEKPEGS